MKRIVTSASCTDCPRRHETEWGHLSAATLNFVNAFKRDRVYEPGEVLYHQGYDCEGIFCIREGLVGERRVNPDGISALVRLNHPGTTLGYQEFLTRSAYRNSTEVLRESHICFLDRTIVAELLARNPSLGERFLRRSLRDLEQTEASYVEAMTTSIRNRLLHTLLVLYERYGCFEEAHGHCFEIPIARQDLASLVGTGPETISRTIRRLQEDRLVNFEGTMVSFPDLDAAYDQIALFD